MTYNIVVDSCFWISLFDPGNNIATADKAEKIAYDISNETIIIPFPTLYEFVNSRLSRREARINVEKLLQKPNVLKIDDTKYKDQALQNFFVKSNYDYSDISLVDEVIKLIIEDPELKIDYLISFDEGLVNAALAQGIRTM